VAPDVRPIPGSLRNIYREYCEDLDYPKPSNGDLSPWADHGILLLNGRSRWRRQLRIAPREGLEEVTEQAIKALAARGKPMVAILWGRDARNLRP